MDVEVGDNVGRGSGGVAASISESSVSDVTRPSNLRLALGGVADSLMGKVDQFFWPSPAGTGDRAPGVVVTRGDGLESRSEGSGILPQDDNDGREVFRRNETDSDTTKFTLRSSLESCPIEPSCIM